MKCEECETARATKGRFCKDCHYMLLREATIEEGMYPREDVYEHMSARDQEWNDRLDYANEVAKTDPERAAEIRMGA